jgi:polyisoprenoid-binding protein YceI
MKTLLAALLLVFASSAQAQARLVPAGSEVVFTSKQMGVPVDGRFRRFDAQVAFDPKKPEAAKIDISIDLGSVALGAAEVEAEVVGPDWFAVKQFPRATFSSAAVKATGPGRYDVTGKLTIKGQSRDVTVPVSLAQAGAQTTATGSFAIKRLDYRIGDGAWNDPSLVADEVQVRFKLVLTGIGAP